jgi:hypothetical protein
MAFTYRPAKREDVALLVGLAGGTGSGKTYTAMRLATGICGADPFAVIDTEAGRAKHYADRFHFDHGDLTPPFTPERYTDAIQAADKAGYRVILVDSTSHEHAGDGGLLDWHETELDRMAGADWKKRDACNMAAWVKPKMAHKKFVNVLLQLRAHLILCFRAEPKVEMSRDKDGRTVVTEKKGLTGLHGWFPVSEKSLPYELTVSFLLLADRPGVPLPIKLQEQHKALFPLDRPITEVSGRELAAWAKGERVSPPAAAASPSAVSSQAAGTLAPESSTEIDPADDYLTLITDATSLAELKTLNAKIKTASTTWPSASIERLRVKYLARVKALTAPPKESKK